ncbi:tyrosinase cofactor [Streptomyces sp. WAC06614]|uniref:apotyrosinase chaperone MelC1 n=1 Tax=Streptomyces sp. WAC06614 TaxID=2487416 RepID=UPI000F7AC005|nr:tyrosinase cofactor [Streptomyces sp. WAC06614]RSS83314.1 tyrosinase [Streptomyces sp. WAC06614]
MNKITRRRALGTTAGALTVLGLAGTAAHAATAPTAQTAISDGALDEVYQGRRIRIVPAQGGGHHGGHHSPGTATVLIDGRELHVMRNADGSFISVVNHYETFPDLPSLARAAVRELQGSALLPFGGAA